MVGSVQSDNLRWIPAFAGMVRRRRWCATRVAESGVNPLWTENIMMPKRGCGEHRHNVAQ